ncbi:MAG: hypothetical protein ACRD2W_09120 [Acidimicrobiales bacterium]
MCQTGYASVSPTFDCDEGVWGWCWYASGCRRPGQVYERRTEDPEPLEDLQTLIEVTGVDGPQHHAGAVLDGSGKVRDGREGQGRAGR